MANLNITAEQYQEYLRIESDKIKAYEEWYSEHKIKKPTEPTKEELSFWNIAGLEASIFVLSGLGAAILSAIRTGGLFFLMEVLLVAKYGLDPVLGFLLGLLAAIASLLTFEGSLVGVGLIKGRESGKIKVSTLVVILSLTTVILASIFSSFTIVELTENIQLFMNIGLALVTGFSSPVATYLLFENVGFVRNFVAQTRIDMMNKFRKDSQEWETSMISSYNASRNTIVKRVGDNYVVQTPNNTNQPEEPEKKKSRVEKAYDFISDYWLNNRKLPTIKIVAKGAGVADGSAFSGMDEFILDNASELLLTGEVNQEKVDKIKLKKNKTPNYAEQLNTFIQNNERFPNEEEINQMGLTTEMVASFIVENDEIIRRRKLLDEETIQKAVDFVK